MNCPTEHLVSRAGRLAVLVALCAGAPSLVQGDGGNAWEAWCATVDRSKLARWERQWLDRKPLRVATVFVTNYGPWEGYRGASWHIAANPAHLKPGTVVWLEKDRCLKVVTNRGASSNDAWAQSDHNPDGSPKQPAEFWVDRWTAQRRGDNGNQRVWVVGRAPWPH